MSSGGASKRQEEPNEQRDPFLSSEASWLINFVSMPVDEAIRDIKAIKPSLFHLGDIFWTENGKFYIVTAGKKDSSDVYFYRIQGLDGTIRVRREDQITDLYGSPTAMPMDQVSQLLSTIDFPNEPTLDAEILTQIYIRRNEDDGTVRGHREMVQISINAAQSTSVSQIRRMMRDSLASLIPAGRQDLLSIFNNLSAADEVGQIVVSANSKYHLGDFFFKGNVSYVVTAGRSIRDGRNAPPLLFYRINGTDDSDRIFSGDEIEKWYGQVQRVHVDQVRSVLMTVPRITTDTGRHILLNRYFLYSESGEPRTRAVALDLERAWLASLQGPSPQPVPEMNDIPDRICSICREPLRGKKGKKNRYGKRKVMKLKGDMEVVMLNCGHFFHKKCILDNQIRGTRDTCPLCRRKVKTMHTDGVLRLRF